MVISRAIAIGNHPCDSALVKIERCNSSVGSFIYRQPIDTEATTPLLLPLPWSTWQRARSVQHRILRIRVLDQTECSRLRHGNGIVHSRFRIERSCIPIARTPTSWLYQRAFVAVRLITPHRWRCKEWTHDVMLHHFECLLVQLRRVVDQVCFAETLSIEGRRFGR